MPLCRSLPLHRTPGAKVTGVRTSSAKVIDVLDLLHTSCKQRNLDLRLHSGFSTWIFNYTQDLDLLHTSCSKGSRIFALPFEAGFRNGLRKCDFAANLESAIFARDFEISTSQGTVRSRFRHRLWNLDFALHSEIVICESSPDSQHALERCFDLHQRAPGAISNWCSISWDKSSKLLSSPRTIILIRILLS